MLFQLAASVAQVGFGHLADRWRPRTLIDWTGRRGHRVEPDWPGHDALRLWRSFWLSAASAPRRFIRQLRRSLIGSEESAGDSRCRSTLPGARSASRLDRSVRAVRAAIRPRVDTDAGAARTRGGRVLSSTRAADPAASVRPSRLRRAPAVREAACAALLHRRAADTCLADVRHVCSGHADPARPVGESAGASVAVYLFGSGVGGFSAVRQPTGLAPARSSLCHS